MAKHTVITVPGDGIGNQVLPEALRVLKTVGFDAEYIHADIGWECWRNEGNALPDRTIDLLAKHKLGLFGAITSTIFGSGHTSNSTSRKSTQRFFVRIQRACMPESSGPTRRKRSGEHWL